jgi:SAM-dependent methyltransferase
MTTTQDHQATASTYSLGSSQREHERLRAQARMWETAAQRVLDQAGLSPGLRCLDAGCGPGETMRQLAQRVGPEGRVVGIDIDAALGELTVEYLHAIGHRQCEFHAFDVTDDAPIPGAPYDLVFARLLLFHLPDRVAVLRRLWDAVAPGGHLVIQEYDLDGVGAVPSLDSVDTVGRYIIDTFTTVGCEVRAGSVLPALFDEAGIGAPDGTDVAGLLDTLGGGGGMLLEQTFRSLRPAALRHDILTDPAADAALEALRDDIVANPGRTVLMPLLIGAWKGKGTT